MRGGKELASNKARGKCKVRQGLLQDQEGGYLEGKHTGVKKCGKEKSKKKKKKRTPSRT